MPRSVRFCHFVWCLMFSEVSVPSTSVTRFNGPGILSGPVEDFRRRHPSSYPEVDAVLGLEVQHGPTGRRGIVVSVGKGAVQLRLANNALVTLRLAPGAFRVDARPVTLTVPRPVMARAPRFGVSGSVEAVSAAKVAAASRIWVEGIHDAELIEKIWGDDLRHVGVVVEPMHGADDLANAVCKFGPSPSRRLGILLDHLIDGTKETREADSVIDALGRDAAKSVLIVGHPFVDVWEAVKPSVVGIDAWPSVPLGESWKQGVCDRLGVGEPALFWRRVLASVTSFTDLDVSLINSVERLVDFVEDESV